MKTLQPGCVQDVPLSSAIKKPSATQIISDLAFSMHSNLLLFYFYWQPTAAKDKGEREEKFLKTSSTAHGSLAVPLLQLSLCSDRIWIHSDKRLVSSSCMTNICVFCPCMIVVFNYSLKAHQLKWTCHSTVILFKGICQFPKKYVHILSIFK